MARIYISLGSNIDPELHLRNAVDALSQHFSHLALSPVYETEAVGFEGDAFLNLVAVCETEASPQAVSQTLKEIEDRNDRKRSGPKFSSRSLDLDLLLYDALQLHESGLEIPRDEITRYAFVLKPLSDIAPELVHPVTQQRIIDVWSVFEGDRGGLKEIDLDLMHAQT